MAKATREKMLEYVFRDDNSIPTSEGYDRCLTFLCSKLDEMQARIDVLERKNNIPWKCEECNQSNVAWSDECGRCGGKR